MIRMYKSSKKKLDYDTVIESYPFFDLVLDKRFDKIDDLVNKRWHIDDMDFLQLNGVGLLKT